MKTSKHISTFNLLLDLRLVIVTLLMMTFLFYAFEAPAFGNTEDRDKVTEILERYSKDYESDVTLKADVIFGVKVGDQFWHIVAKAKTTTAEAKVTVRKGKPEQPTFYFFTDQETLIKIDNGEMNALTASAKAFETDFAPFDVDVMEGYQPHKDFMNTLMSVYFHFWTRGLPEVIPFGLDVTRMTHGAQAAIFYYQPGFRSAYVAIKKGQHANKDEKSKSNPFPSMLILIKGEGQAIINGNKIIVKAGQSIVIPAGVMHEFLNPDHDQPLEGILLMFGKGA